MTTIDQIYILRTVSNFSNSTFPNVGHINGQSDSINTGRTNLNFSITLVHCLTMFVISTTLDDQDTYRTVKLSQYWQKLCSQDQQLLKQIQLFAKTSGKRCHHFQSKF